ncbi:hypothetical protein EFA46_016090 (plasmid) [Halarchaeum sp. CBA1220]|uniref:ribbon-helix-helix domain-containing protein n=1 Tax=Halarchaeum sp. CBA1220 TaxID=1853682 RepID=UPI0015A29A60|nr:ribbon-helix-helix domain-containing protein [Halarchaeum sp. CBA1220]QLC35777.1 hypothetical protein EFA46_016090 [Halarchaeum sp. CBA1220]
MEPNTLRLPEETWDALEEEATEYGYRNRSEYVRNLIERRHSILDAPDAITPENTEANTNAHTDAHTDANANTPDYEAPLTGHGFEDLTDVAERLTALEERVAELEEDRNPPSPQNGSESPESDSSPETMDTPHEERNETVSTPVDAREDDTALSAEWILENAAWSEHEVTATDGRAEALAEAHAIVATTDDVTSGELAERLVEDDRVGLSEGTVRNHLLPVLGSLPGVVQPGSGQRKWRYEDDYSTNS